LSDDREVWFVTIEDKAAFNVSVRLEGETAWLVLSGEFDLAGMPEAQFALQQAIETDAESVVIDLAELLFIDSTGLRFVIGANDRCAELQRPLSLRRGSETVHRVFEMTRLDGVLPFAS
jgi:anti-anti-sigma factor